MQTIHPLLKQLNEKQRQAVSHIEGPLLVIAGAGSGKTHVVTSRIAYLIECGIPANEIVAVTFTNKAAEEMQSRIRHLCQHNVLVGTFHSLCARILRESITHLEYQSNFVIYDQTDSENLIKSCFKTLGITNDKSTLKSIKSAISNAKNELISPEDLIHSTEKETILLHRIYTQYQTFLKQYNALDFDDLLYLCVKLLQQFPEIKLQYQKRWSFFLVDEYQDTNKAQYILTSLLSEKSQNLCVVGDPDQSIYSFRGANIQNILNFQKDYPQAPLISLECNYRSTPHILNTANHIIQNNVKRIDKKLYSSFPEGNKVVVTISDTEQEEAQILLESIEILYPKYHFSEMVIFYRTNSQSRIYEDYLLRHKIPYQIIGGLSFYARKEIKDILSFIRILLYPNDFLAFERTINIPKRGFGKTTLLHLQQLTEQLHIPILDLCSQLLTDSLPEIKLNKKQRIGLKEYLNAIQSVKEFLSAPIYKVLKEIISHFYYFEYLKCDEESYLDRKSNVEELVSKSIEWVDEQTNSSLETFLEELSLKSQVDAMDPFEDRIKLMTLHNSKGLEFPIVFIVGMEEDLFPHLNCKETPEMIEEERRLAYVGITRAKKKLYLSAAKYRLIWGSPRMMRPSRFLSELPEKHIITNQSAYSESSSEEFLPGTLVYHKSFGKGVIKKTYQSSLGLTYDVYFPSGDSLKTLIAKYAKLKGC